MLQGKWQPCFLLLLIVFSNSSDAYDSTKPNINDAFVEDGPQDEPVSGRMLYYFNLHTISHAVTDAPAGGGSFCVAITNADQGALTAGLNWACGPGGANCTAIQPGGPCYSNSVVALASYAYNDYYQRNKATGGTCNFSNTAMLSPTDPSSGSCIFTGSSGTGFSPGGGGGGTGTNSSTNSSTGGGGFIPNPSPFGPTPFGPTPLIDGVSRLQLSKLTISVVSLMLFLWFML